MVRDGSLNADDRIEILLDTFRDQRSAFYFATNPAGALVDGLAFANGQLNTEWDAIWHVRTTRTSSGWTAEFAIPFKSLSFPAGQNVWGFNIARTISRKLEDDRWSGARLDTQFLQVSEAGEITNLGGLTQGIGLDLRPFLAGRWLHLAGNERRRLQRQARTGYLLQHHAEPQAHGDDQHRLRRDGSRRAPDQSHALLAVVPREARVLSRRRRRVQLCEHRPRNARRHSRHRRRPVPVLQPPDRVDRRPGGSARRRRQAHRHRRADRSRRAERPHPRVESGTMRWIADDEGFLIGRVKQNLFEQSYVGAIFTAGNPSPGASAQTYGADARLATSRFLGRQRNFVVDGFAVRGVTGSDSKRRLVVRILGGLSERQVRRAGGVSRDPAELPARAGVLPARQRAAAARRAPATTRARNSSTSSRCFTTSTTRGSPTSTTTWSRAGICTSRRWTGTSDRATACTRCSM